MKGEGGRVKNSPLSPCGRGVGGEGSAKMGYSANPSLFRVGEQISDDSLGGKGGEGVRCVHGG